MALSTAFATDYGKNLNDSHFGMAKQYHIYEFSTVTEEAFVEQRRNVDAKENESMKHGDPHKAKATASVLKGIDVFVGKKFGPNLPRLLKHFVCVIVRAKTMGDAIKIINNNMDKIVEEKNKGQERKHIVLTS